MRKRFEDGEKYLKDSDNKEVRKGNECNALYRILFNLDNSLGNESR